MQAGAATSGFIGKLVLAILVIALALFLWRVRDAVLLTFAAILLALAAHGIAEILTKISLPERAALPLAGVLLIGALVGVVWLFGAQLSAELAGVIERLPAAWARAKEALGANPLGARLISEIDRIVSGESGGSLQSMAARAGDFAFPFASGITTALLVVFTAAFLTANPRCYRRGALLLLPRGLDEKAAAAFDDTAQALKKWLLGISIDMILIALSVGVALWLLEVPAFVGLALIAGFAQFVPTIGPLVASVPGILLALTVSPMTALWTALAYLVITQLEANVVYPLIQSKTASIPPALNLVAVLAFGMLLGPLGVLLATPLLLVFYVFAVRLYVQDSLGKSAHVPGS